MGAARSPLARRRSFSYCERHQRARGLFWGLFGAAVVFAFCAEFIREYRIARDWRASVGTVLHFQKFQYKKGARIKYVFKSADNRMHLNNYSGSSRLPKDGATLAILYNATQPEHSLPLSGFLFYEKLFAQRTQTARDEEQNVLQS